MRFIASSAALLKMLARHTDSPVSFSIKPYKSLHLGTLVSAGLTNELPIEALRTSEVETRLPLAETLAVLRGIENQPITLDLHAELPNRIYASRRVDTVQGWENIHFDLSQA